MPDSQIKTKGDGENLSEGIPGAYPINILRNFYLNWRRILASSSAGFWLFISLAFFGSMIWAKSRDPFDRIWFTLKTPHYGKVKGVAVLPKVDSKRRSQSVATGLPVVYYVYGSGGNLIHCGNELRQFAELGMAAVAIEYDQMDESAFPEQFTALREYVAKQKWAIANAEPGTRSAECWIGFSMGANRTLDYLLKTVGESPTATGGSPVLPLPRLYVRLAGGAAASRASAPDSFSKSAAHLRDAATKVLLVHGENDEIFPVAEAKQVAELFQTNGVATDLKILPGKRHAFDSDRVVVMRNVGEYVKAQLTPDHPQPEFPVTKNHPFSFVLPLHFSGRGSGFIYVG